MLELQRLTSDHLQAGLAYELENRAYFARSVTDRADEFYETLAEHHRALLDEQDAGTCAFFVLVDGDGSIVGRFNLYDLGNGTAGVGYGSPGAASQLTLCPTSVVRPQTAVAYGR
jgi:[ribosomal protein S5]-alanine N-acetyltransferase